MRLQASTLSGIAVLSFVAPLAAGAQTLLNTLALVNTFLNAAIGLLVTVAIIAFFYGLVKYLFNGAAEGKAEGLKTMLYGILAIFVMVSVWGIVRLLQNTLKVTSTDPIIPKGIQISTGGSY